MSPQEYWLAVWEEDPERLERYRALYKQSAKKYEQHMADIKHCHAIASKSSQNAPESPVSNDPALGPADIAEDAQRATEKEEDVLEEALRITSGSRQAQYGPPDQDFTRTAAMWSALFADKLSKPFEARDVAMAMILLKLSRETHQKKRDNATDIAGYARCMHICNKAEELRQQNT